MTEPASTAASAAVPPLFVNQAPDKVSGLIHAATMLARTLEKGRAIDAKTLRAVMVEAFGASDSAGAWVWKDAYEAVESALVLFLCKFGAAMAGQAAAPETMLAMIERLATLTPSETRRSEESQALQQFSTPIPLAYVAVRAARIAPGTWCSNPRRAPACWPPSPGSAAPN